jgi:hypothetical protein
METQAITPPTSVSRSEAITNLSVFLFLLVLPTEKE